ncbi:hypothetical protein M8818_002656 [Zalaria obscura]|uniref:Uncharacterized protein n=1 Tax=Zalaria obscura TaxID=2024903 RepID=A0ACC3SKX5_9PEZI
MTMESTLSTGGLTSNDLQLFVDSLASYLKWVELAQSSVKRLSTHILGNNGSSEIDHNTDVGEMGPPAEVSQVPDVETEGMGCSTGASQLAKKSLPDSAVKSKFRPLSKQLAKMDSQMATFQQYATGQVKAAATAAQMRSVVGTLIIVNDTYAKISELFNPVTKLTETLRVVGTNVGPPQSSNTDAANFEEEFALWQQAVEKMHAWCF